ncbi:ABC transporter permease subunit [Rhizobium sp. NZLR1]|uniref:ABC transporter permease n=1 Tax=Rhizobium sp. NZLR1 TaxID=2731096 RepID=UPI001A9950CC|nr:ABC transporter permease subunit [Rhizobium sp. NZLR1]MBX5204041.1 ABC transporter permease subunit [Rhizobium sp. NZLR1]QSZ25160.1 ABC transporter permease subunit [Rhizobium sp. NZLR1]
MAGLQTRFISNYWGIIVLLLVWASSIHLSNLNSIVLPSPAMVAMDVVGNPELYVMQGLRTLLIASVGLLLGIAAGTALAVVSWLSTTLRGMLTPLALVLGSVPVVALIPIIARLIGAGTPSILSIVAIITFFPAFVLTSSGMQSVPLGSKDLFQVLGARKVDLLTRLALPAAVPHWLVSLRTSAPLAMLAAMTGEFLIGSSGLGYLLRVSSSNFQTSRVIGAALLSTVFALMMVGATQALEREALRRWK